MSRKISLGEIAKRAVDTSIHSSRALAAMRGEGALCAYERLLLAVRSCSTLLGRRSVLHACEVQRALLAMALHHTDWLLPVESWRPRAGSVQQQLASLAEHLFARYPVPRFMASVWLGGEPGEITAEQGWYKSLGLGQNIRRVDVPMRITRAMAHQLLSAPCHLGVVSALRWAQVIALGGSEELVRSLLPTRLGRVLEHEETWEDVLQFLVSHPDFPLEQVGPLVDFVQHQKHEWRDGVSADGTFGRQPPPQPELVLVGRSCASLLRLVHGWHRELGRRSVSDVAWDRAPFRDFLWVEKRRAKRDDREEGAETEDRVWTISELCTSRALVLEGRAMRHCVSIYVRSCVSRRSSIWSMQAETRRGTDRVLTIEVDLPRRRVVQARRKCNASPGPLERTLVRRWAEQEGIVVPPTLRDLA